MDIKGVRSFATYTVHFLDSSWKMKSYVLATRPLDERHTADNVSNHARAVIHEFGLDSNVTALVHDEASNMVAASRSLRQDGTCAESLVCSAHMLQTCLRHAIDDSPQVQKMLGQARKLVTYFHHSSVATNRLVKRQESYIAAGNAPSGSQPLKVRAFT